MFKDLSLQPLRLGDAARQFLDPRDDPPLLGQRGEGNLQREEQILLEVSAVRCPFACADTEITKELRPRHPSHKLRIDSFANEVKSPKIASDDGVMTLFWDNPKCSVPGVDLGKQQLP